MLEHRDKQVLLFEHISKLFQIQNLIFFLSYKEGRILWDPTLPEIKTPEERAGIYDSMNATLAALHNVNVEAVGLGTKQYLSAHSALYRRRSG